MSNKKNVTEFILLGLSQDQNVQIFLTPNTVGCSHLINQPMYYFLAHLSSIDVSYTSTISTKMIWDILAKTKVIIFDNCMFLLFSMHFFTCTEVFILMAMAFNCCVAICRLLHYMVIMSRKKCKLLILHSWNPFSGRVLQSPLHLRVSHIGGLLILHALHLHLPATSSSYSVDKVFSLFFTIIPPMFNPLTYTLRNIEMKNAMRKIWHRKVSS
ncbi:olfactory receptor 4P4-like [Tachyglossus aculeatus]|uniref:olfactory receptor 4P4-like n=1 Tax=Tachyglossus aculeatus TaxID=9261 RepID=UPI0018F5B10A|nr:olfactory receptor 4P4-like [Tachyglossus aculeatus]